MKLSAILENHYMDQIKRSLGPGYWPKTMAYEPGEYDDTDDIDQESKIYMPSHTTIDELDIVELQKENETILEDQWANIKAYIEDHWSTMSGYYKIVQDGQVLHSFEIS